MKAPLENVRRLAVTRQHLSGRLPGSPGGENILSLLRDIAFIQWDPINIVAPSHQISIWSRAGNFRQSDLEDLFWKSRKVFLYWTPIASMVLTEDYPIYHSLMKRFPDSLSGSWGSQRTGAREFLFRHQELKKEALHELEDGPLEISGFKGYRKTKRSDDGWSSGSDISRMILHLHMMGEVMVVGHRGNQNVWGLTRDFLPDWASRDVLSEEECERAAAKRAISALGAATPSEINYYFVRGRYNRLKKTLAELQNEAAIHRLVIEGFPGRDERYILDDDIPLLESMNTSAWEPRLTLLSPFDNLIAGRDRTNRLFGFDYIHEQFVPKEKRKFGTYVLPILYGDRLIGRIDARMDRSNGKLIINSVYAEEGAPADLETASMIQKSIEQLSGFLGAEEVEYGTVVPAFWKSSLH